MSGNKDIGQLKPVECNYPECIKRFDTEKEMKRHKAADPTHFYCKKCDVDCEDHDGLKLHKIAAMEPWLHSPRPAESPKHIVCEFCGKDFQSFGGRRLHREQLHQAKQHIECPGAPRCGEVSNSAGNLLAHFENGNCPVITRRQFLDKAQHKHINKAILEDPKRFIQDVTDESPGLVEERSETQDTYEGGVNLIDLEEEHQKYGAQPLRAGVDLIGGHGRRPLTRSNLEKWPYLPGQEATPLTTSMEKLSIASSATETGSHMTSINESQMTASEFNSRITSRGGGNKVDTESWPSINPASRKASKSTKPNDGEDDDAASEVTTTVSSTALGSAVRATGSASRVLFKDARPTPPPVNWDAVTKKHEEETVTQSTNNLFQSRFWDPRSAEFDLSRFRGQEASIFICPFKGCEDVIYDMDVDLIGHLEQAHLKRQYRCPLCLKVFKVASALISHSESPGGKCKVKKSSKYAQLLNEISGGFLDVEYLKEPKVARENEDGHLEGIMTTKFTAQMPQGV